MALTWTNEEIDFLVSRKELSPKEAWLDFSSTFPHVERSYDSVQKKLRQLKLALEPENLENNEEEYIASHDEEENPFVNTPAPIVPPIPYQDKLENRKQVTQWLAELATIRPSSSTVRTARHEVNNSSLVVVLSDLHFGKKTDSYNLDEAEKRTLSIPDQIFSRLDTDINEIVIVMAGDMIEGEDIYSNQNTHVECSALEQTQRCTSVIWKMIIQFASIWDGIPIRIVAVPGNHGRVSHTANELSNWDNVVYYCLSLLIDKSDLPIFMETEYDAFKLFTVKDKVGMVYHHGVKHSSTPAMREKIAGWIAKKRFDFMVHGHWHEWHIGNWLGKLVISNGCLCGPDDLAERMGKEEDARQAYFLVTPHQPVHSFSYVEWKEDE